MAAKKTKKRLVLAEGHPYFITHPIYAGKGFFGVRMYPADCAGDPIKFNIDDLGGYNKIRLVAEVIE